MKICITSTGKDLEATVDQVFGDVITRLAEQGLLADDGQSVRLTERAYLISNRVFVHFVEDGSLTA